MAKPKRDLFSSAKTLGYQVFLILQFILTWLNSSVYGILALSLAFYFNAARLGLSEPLSGSELVQWLVLLPDGVKIAVSSSLLTIVGFLIAFQTATKNWKAQMTASAALKAGYEIQEFFTEASDQLNYIDIFCDQLIAAAATIETSQDVNEINFEIDMVNNNLQKFTASRDRIIEMNGKVYGLFSKHAQNLAAQWGALKNFHIAAQAMNNIVETAWFPVPTVRSADLGARNLFLGSVDVERCTKYREAYKSNFEMMNAISGMVVGRLSGAITKFNIPFLMNSLPMMSWLTKIQKAKPRIQHPIKQLKGE